MRYHLDTNVCVAALKGVVTVHERIRSHADDLAVSTVVLGELYCGAFRSQRVAQNLEVLAEFVAGIEVIPFDTEAGRESLRDPLRRITAYRPADRRKRRLDRRHHKTPWRDTCDA